MGKISERQKEKYKIWAMAVLLTGVCISLYYFHVMLRIGTIITHLFYVPIILASIWWKRKGLIVAVFSSIFLIFSHIVLRPDVATHNDYFRAFMFVVIALVVAELSRRFAKEHEALQAANQQLSADEQQLRAANQQLSADEQQLKASNQQLRANEQQLVSEVAERKSAEERVREQREFLRNTIESLSYPFYVIDANDKTIKMANSTAWQGKLPEKITCYMLSHKQNKPCDGADHPCPLEDIKKTKQPVIVEHIHYDKDGNPRNVEVHAYPVFDNEQNVTQIIEYCLDITERKKAEEALRESENSYRSVVENAVEGIVVVQGQTLQFVNPALVSMIGYSEKELLTRPFIEFIHPDHRERANEIHIKRLKGEEVPPIYQLKVLDKKGNVKWLENNGILIKWRNRPATLNFLRDITERKRAEEALRSERDKLQTLMGGLALTGVGIDVVSIDYRVLFQNQTLIERFGDITGELCYEKYMGLKKPCDFCTMTKAIRNKEVESVELTAIDGRSYELLSAPLVNPDGTVDKAIEVVKDITEHKQAQKALRESELKFKTIFENAGGAIFIADNKTGEILECNSQAEQMLGRPRAEIIGMHQSELHPKGEEEKYKEKFAAHVRKGRVVDFEGEVQHRDGTRIPVWIASQCLKIGGKDVIIGLFVDTTERKKAEEKLLEHEARLKSLASELSLVEERERRQLATELHDRISQSLVISRMKLQALLKSASASELAAPLEEACNGIAQIIQDTRTLTFDLSSPILYELGFEAAVAEWLDEQIQKKHGIKTEFEDDRRPKPLDDDIRVLLFRNVRELLINIVKHANAQNVKVSIYRIDEQVCVSVEDDGVGFDPAEVASKAGFGIFSIRERLEQLGGHLEIESEPGRGSKITMTAPLKYEKNT